MPILSKMKGAWSQILPGPGARKGFAWGCVAAAAGAAVVGALTLHSGFGYLAVALTFGVAVLGIPLAALVIILLLTILRKLPRLITGVILAAGIFNRHSMAVRIGLPDRARVLPCGGRARRDDRDFSGGIFSSGAPVEEDSHECSICRNNRR